MAPKKLSIRIDGELISAFEGQTILQAARANGTFIPTLCALDGLSDVGACRICLVEVSGTERLFPACTTPIQEGMSVTTNSPRLTRYRRISVELLLIERNHVCAVCVSNGHCELQSMATTLGISTVEFAYNFPKLSIDVSHPRFVLDHNRCILCTRCVRVCAELEGAHVWDMTSRGIHARM
ncbi:MAG TPA: 2Fe-2S iron-sulfur cluster-binding protein, partial [Terriglobales bacterium]|nr:2Fe-2S iron-sulfur cluster-binding protein [Terriglobales bacterium]